MLPVSKPTIIHQMTFYKFQKKRIINNISWESHQINSGSYFCLALTKNVSDFTDIKLRFRLF